MPTLRLLALAVAALPPSLGMALPSLMTARQFDGTRHQPGIECDTFIRPNFDDCASIISGNSYFGGDEMTVCVNPRVCRIWRSGNCRISFCNNEDIEVCDSNNEWGRRTNEIIDFCGETNQGGYETPAEPAPWTEVVVRSDQDWLAALGGTAHELWVYQELSIEEKRHRD
ncbi:hypothetical protein MFIFM68171_09958 [Madurella fahalii]|uniref:Uncharacterized protein n=1 Tax=Madurella fahalii TaxID=1157608 RepID=A0ABQ0GPS8_9PEZI